MDIEDTIALLAAAPATAYREYLYRPRGQFARWMGDRFAVVAGPGQHISQPWQQADLLIEVPLGPTCPGRCVTLAALDLEFVASRPRLAPGQLLLRPRRFVDMSEPLPVGPAVAPGDTDLGRLIGVGELPPSQTTDPVDAVAAEHDFGDDDAEAHPPVPVDAAAAVPPFSPTEHATVVEPLLSARESAKALAWSKRAHPGISGVTLDEIRDALRSYVDPVAVQVAIDRQNKRESGDLIDASSPATDAVLVECVHQFQRKCYCERREHDGQAGESTLDSLGLIVRAGSGFRGADRGNATAQQRLNKHDGQI